MAEMMVKMAALEADAELRRIQKYEVDVTLDPDTAHRYLIMSEDGKQVSDGDVRNNLPDNPERFSKCICVLGKQGFSSGRFYYEVQVGGKTRWGLGVARESINRKGSIRRSPNDGYWSIGLEKGNEYGAAADRPVRLPVKGKLQKVGVFVDYEEGLVSFYDVEARVHLYSFTGCSFTEKLFPVFSPGLNDGGINSAPLIISPVNHELRRIQQYEVDVTLDPDTAHRTLILSEDRKQVRKQVSCGDKRKKLPDNPKRFSLCANVLGKQEFSSGRFYYEVQVGGKTKWYLGVARESINRKGVITQSPNNGYWAIRLRNGNNYWAADDFYVRLPVKGKLQKVGVFVDYEVGLVSFYDVEARVHLYSFTGCSFTEKLFPFFGPCNNEGGINSAPLIISPVNHELRRIQKYEVDVTLDPDTAHPHLILSEDGKQVSDGDVWKKLPDNTERFSKCINVLGKQGFSSGRFYYEVQVGGKTKWYLGVARESIDRKGSLTLNPNNGSWAIGLRNGNKYYAMAGPRVLPVKGELQTVGVFVDYEEGLVSFYDVEARVHLYSFTGCSFTEKLFPLFSPHLNAGGINSAPLIIHTPSMH